MATLEEEIKADALEAMKLTRKYFVVELDFSDVSVVELETLFEQVHYALPGGSSEENVAKLTRVWGGYLGEVLRRRCGGQWIKTNDDRIALRGEKTTLHPHEKVRERLLGDSKDSIRKYFDAALERL